MSGTPASTPSMTPSWTLPLPAGGRRQFLHIDIEANIPADNGSHPRNGLAPGAEAHRPSPLPRIATTTSSFAPEAPQAPLRCNGGNGGRRSLGGAPIPSRSVWRRRCNSRARPGDVGFPVKLTYRDLSGVISPNNVFESSASGKSAGHQPHRGWRGRQTMKRHTTGR